MGISRPSGDPVESLVDELIVRLGFSRAGDVAGWLTAHPDATPDDVVDAVLRAEGLDPVTTETALRRQVHASVLRWLAASS